MNDETKNTIPPPCETSAEQAGMGYPTVVYHLLRLMCKRTTTEDEVKALRIAARSCTKRFADRMANYARRRIAKTLTPEATE